MLPAKVESVTFQSDNVLNAGMSLQWDKWSVQFGPEAPIAIFHPCSAPAACNRSSGTDIENLECMNDVVGTVPCTMDIRYSYGNYFCSRFMGKVHFANKQSVYIEINVRRPLSCSEYLLLEGTAY